MSLRRYDRQLKNVNNYSLGIQFQEIYIVSGGHLKSKNPQYNDLPHKYEMTLSNFSTVEKVKEKDDSIPLIEFDFKKICDISELEEGMTMGKLKLIK